VGALELEARESQGKTQANEQAFGQQSEHDPAHRLAIERANGAANTNGRCWKKSTIGRQARSRRPMYQLKNRIPAMAMANHGPAIHHLRRLRFAELIQGIVANLITIKGACEISFPGQPR
jgi:hypothetical protein